MTGRDRRRPPDPPEPRVLGGAAASRRPQAPARYARPVEIVTILLGPGAGSADQADRAADAVPLHDTINVIPGLLDLTHVQNTGAAFGLLNAAEFPYKPAVMIGIAAIALVAIAAYGAQLGFHERLARLGLSLILGGAFGNLIDRAFIGHVVDFVDVYWGNSHFWAFNVADAAITIGAVLVLLDMIGLGRHHASHPV